MHNGTGTEGWADTQAPAGAKDPVVIIGSGHSGVAVAAGLRTRGWEGGILLIDAESGLPYERPPLSKELLKDGAPEGPAVLRKEKFYAEKGDQVIWRVESWPFVWMRDVWHKPRKGLRVWQRLRISAAEFARMGHVFDPALGGIEVKAGETTTLDYTLPAKLPASLGKTPAQ